MPLVMPDSREPVPTTLGFAISRWGRPGELAATGAAGEDPAPAQRSRWRLEVLQEVFEVWFKPAVRFHLMLGFDR